ncbi:MMPL family transporter [Nocardia cyriacigeorgica]|nr:MMPL family transporter [Nocardia cyriacigeorgica]
MFCPNHEVGTGPSSASRTARSTALLVSTPETIISASASATQPTSSTAHKAYDSVSQSFGPGFSGPLMVVTDLSQATSPDAAQTLMGRMQQEPGVAAVQPAGSGNGIMLIQVIPKTGPDDPATKDLVNRLRDDRDRIESGTGATYLVGGTTAANIDTSDRLADALPVFLAVVVGLALVLLTIAFRTVLVPLSSIAGFILSVFAACATVDNPIVKPLAFTLAVGVLLDALIVRLTPIPAFMALIGNRIWYHPRWFDRSVPDLDVEGAELEHRFATTAETDVVDSAAHGSDQVSR